MKTLKELKQTKTYRFFKVFYFLFLSIGIIVFIGSIIFTTIAFFNDGTFMGGYYEFSSEPFDALGFLLFVIISLEFIRRIFYYVYFGNFFPKK